MAKNESINMARDKVFSEYREFEEMLNRVTDEDVEIWAGMLRHKLTEVGRAAQLFGELVRQEQPHVLAS